MPRRVSLPAADELFRTTGGTAVQHSTPPARTSDQAASAAAAGEPDPGDAPRLGEEAARAASGEAESAGATGGDAPPAAARRGAASAARRTTGQAARPATGTTGRAAGGQQASGPVARARSLGATRRRTVGRRPSGRERHDEKITVYVSAEELMDLEHARLVLRGEHGLAVDRGRIVREAVAVVLADLESRGDASILVRRLRGR